MVIYVAFMVIPEDSHLLESLLLSCNCYLV